MKDALYPALKLAHEQELWQPGSRILVACSGGVDSLALMVWLARLQAVEAITVGVAYVHHHLRSAADDEVSFVESVCVAEGVPFYRLDVDVPTYVKQHRGSTEAAARVLRYEALDALMQREAYTLLATAHHADDQAETVLHHLLRGTGLVGLSGMKPKQGYLIRPFLAVDRLAIERYVDELVYEPRIDESNADVRFFRNAIRHEVLPYLRQYSPNIDANLCRLADIAQGESVIWDDWYLKAQNWIEIHDDARRMKKSVYVDLAIGYRRRLVRAMFSLVGIQPDYRTVELVDQWIRTGRTGGVYRADGLELILEASYIRWQPIKIIAKDTVRCADFDESGIATLGGVRVRICESKTPVEGCLSIPRASLTGALRLRYRLAGDRIRVPKVGTKKWKDWLIDHHVPGDQRDGIVLLADDKMVYRAFGYICSEPLPMVTDSYIIMKEELACSQI